jgi:hypothetical protein
LSGTTALRPDGDGYIRRQWFALEFVPVCLRQRDGVARIDEQIIAVRLGSLTALRGIESPLDGFGIRHRPVDFG